MSNMLSISYSYESKVHIQHPMMHDSANKWKYLPFVFLFFIFNDPWEHAVVVHWSSMLHAGRSRIRFYVRSLDFSINLILPAAILPWVWTGIFLGAKGSQTEGKADKLAAICEWTVEEIWEPRNLTTLWASTACYRDSCTFLHNDSVSSEITQCQW
jgi:hypothetical protein